MITSSLETESYLVRDAFFGSPYLDCDEHRDGPIAYRHVHGGFENTDTRFTFYFVDKDAGYVGRLFHPIEGAHAGHEDFFGGPFGELMGGLPMIARLGGYMVESNAGHIGDTFDNRGGPDATLYGHRAQAESAHFSKHLARQVYGAPPHHSYVWGGSGGGRRSPLCLEYAPDVYDGALPFMGGGDIAEHGVSVPTQAVQAMAFSVMFNVQRLLKDDFDGIIDTMQPGGSGNPYGGLSTHQREELASLYRLGYPCGDEFMIANPMGQIWLWSSIAESLLEQDGQYFDDFWHQRGYVGHDEPDAVASDVIDVEARVSRVLTANDLLTDAAFAGPEYTAMRLMTMLGAGSNGPDFPLAILIEGVGSGYRLGTSLELQDGEAAGRRLYCTSSINDLFLADGVNDANTLRFTGVEPGDRVRVDNRSFLAFCYYYRHHVMDDPAFDFLRLDGQPIYPQNTVPFMSPLMGVPYSGQYEGKLLWVHHTHDASLWPAQGTVYERAVMAAQGPEKTAENFRLRWTENAEHVPYMILPSSDSRATSTWLIDYMPVIEQSLLDLTAWVEDGVEPAGTQYEYGDGKITLPTSALERGGIQPVVTVTVNGRSLHEASAGESVTLELTAEVPPDAGTIIKAEWDFDGSGTYPFQHDIDGKETAAKLTTTHVFDRPGTYFVTARVESHREGDTDATARRIPNLASARVVVT